MDKRLYQRRQFYFDQWLWTDNAAVAPGEYQQYHHTDLYNHPARLCVCIAGRICCRSTGAKAGYTVTQQHYSFLSSHSSSEIKILKRIMVVTGK